LAIDTQEGSSAQGIPSHFSSEMRALAESIRSSILTANPDVRWDSIVGLEEAARLLKEAVIQPIKYPELFTGWYPKLLFMAQNAMQHIVIQ
jgi:SpoVK/Ycf46/Vps4 family AAA+-type ATPase